MSMIPGSMDSDGEEEVETAEQELTHLKSKLRIRQTDRKKYIYATRVELDMQQQLIAQLEAEAAEMKKDMALAGSRRVVARDDDSVRKMVRLQRKDDEMKRLLQEEESASKRLEKQLKEMEKMVRVQHKCMGGIHQQQQKHVTMKKHIRVMENRLNTLTKEFNSLLAKNRVLRDTIDHLGVERATFEKVRVNLEEKLSDARDELELVVKDARKAHEGREDATQKMKTTKEKMEKDFAHFSQEIRELARGIDHTRIMKEFMSTKGQERADPAEIAGHTESRIGREVAQEREKVETSEAVIKEVMSTVGCDNVDDLVQRFQQIEDDNFALFNYINDQSNITEDLQTHVDNLKKQVDKLQSEGAAVDEERNTQMRELENQLDERNKRYSNMLANYSAERLAVDQLKTGIGSLFNRLDCDPTPINDLLGGQLGITDDNVLEYLSIVEQKSAAILQLQTFLLTKESDSVLGATRENALLTGEDVETALEAARSTLPVSMLMSSLSEPPQPLEYQVEAPSTRTDPGAMSSDSDDGDEILDTERLRERALRELSKKEARRNMASPPPADSSPEMALASTPSGISRTTSLASRK